MKIETSHGIPVYGCFNCKYRRYFASDEDIKEFCNGNVCRGNPIGKQLPLHVDYKGSKFKRHNTRWEYNGFILHPSLEQEFYEKYYNGFIEENEFKI